MMETAYISISQGGFWIFKRHGNTFFVLTHQQMWLMGTQNQFMSSENVCFQQEVQCQHIHLIKQSPAHSEILNPQLISEFLRNNFLPGLH